MDRDTLNGMRADVDQILTRHQEWVEGKGDRPATLREAELVGEYHRLNGVEEQGPLAAKLGQIAQRADELAAQHGGSKEAYYDFSPHLLGQRNAESSPAPSRWETVKERVGAWFSREEAVAVPPPAERPEAQAGRDPAGGQHLAAADRAPTSEEGRAACDQILERPEEVQAAIANIPDPADRAKAERLLATVQREETARQRTPERAATAELDR